MGERDRANNDLEVIIKHESGHELVGWITNINAGKLRRMHPVVFDLSTGLPDSGLGEPKDRISITLAMGEMRVRITRFELAWGKGRQELTTRYASQAEDKARDEFIFTWPALIIEPAQFEQVFDHSFFEPR